MSHATEGDLHAWLDGGLQAIDGGAARRLGAHLERCPDCRAKLEEERVVRDRANELLGMGLPAVDVPPFDLVASSGPGRASWLSTERMGWAAAVVIALGAGWMGNALLRGSADSPLAPASADVAIAGSEGGRDAAAANAAPGERLADAGVGREDAVEASPLTEAVSVESPETVVAGPAESVAKTQAAQEAPAPVAELRARQDVAGAGALDATRVGETEALGPVASRAEAQAAAPPAAVPITVYDEIASDLRTTGDRDASVEWRATSESGAASVLGRPALRIEGLEVVSIDVGDLARRPAVLVTQRLPGGELVRLIQESAASAVGEAPPAEADARLERRAAEPEADDTPAPAREDFSDDTPVATVRNLIDGVRVTVWAPLSPDSLASLVSRIRGDRP